MSGHIELHFESIALLEQRVRGQPDDYLLCIVRFSFGYPDGRVETGCVATVRDWLREPGANGVEITIPAACQCPTYVRIVERAVDEYYHERVGTDGAVIRIGPGGASPQIVGAPLAAPEDVVIHPGSPPWAAPTLQRAPGARVPRARSARGAP